VQQASDPSASGSLPPACTLWLTGLSGAGKSTLAGALQQHLGRRGRACSVLDGDRLRTGLNQDLGFSPQDRRENIRRIAEVARLMNDAGLMAIAAVISPYRDDRDMARRIVGEAAFVEVHVSTPLAVCEQRDPKGLYKRARNGTLPGFTGVSAPYEPPPRPALVLDTSRLDVPGCVEALLRALHRPAARGPRPGRRAG
jgi:adenylylsulfate kinase